MSRVISLVLGGGRGTRLYPLTKSRSKPAVPIGGKYRLIDIPIANCIHSDLNRIFVLTQFNSVSLHRHIANTYVFDAFGGGFVEVLAAQQTMHTETWYQGTADAVRRNIQYFKDGDYELTLILSGDQLYRMDFRKMIATHKEAHADVTIATLPVGDKEASGCGIMRIDAAGRVTDFVEKPKTPEALARVRTEPDWMARRGIYSRGRAYLASMGIYLFNTRTLIEMLQASGATDFGKEVFPRAIQNLRVQAHIFDSYWEDIGTIGAFHQANIDLTKPDAPFDFAGHEHRIYTRPRYLACSKIAGATINDSLVADGCIIGRGTVIEGSVIGIRARIGENVTIRNSYVMGLDYLEGDRQSRENQGLGRPNLGIASGTVIENAIVDKNARIGRDCRIVNHAGVKETEEHPTYMIRDGIVVVPRQTTIADLSVI
jgi:glucose-1-phosphate adenylyltransferase